MKKNIKPKKRSAARIFLGKLYFRLKRYFQWYFSNIKYAKTKSKEKLPCFIFSHKTPLFRKLKKVDQWMQTNKIKNLKLASSKINGILIKPGETFSYWKLIGKPTAKKGYLDGMILFYGKITSGTGGGLCQLSNLIYWVMLHSPLTIKERYRHSYDVFPDSNRENPFGTGATCVYNYRDLQVLNNTDSTFQLIINLTDSELIVQLRSNHEPIYTYKVYEKEHKITHELWGAYIRHNLIHRKIFDIKGKLVSDHPVTENHALMMYEPFLEGK